MSIMGDKLLNQDFLSLFLEKNSDKTMHLRLKGKELYQRFGSRLKSRHMRTVATFMLKYPQIVSVDFCYNDFGDRGMETFSEYYFNKPNNLLHINLMQCDITDKGMVLFSSSSHLHLKTCRLNGNKLGAQGARFIAGLIENCPTLEYLDIAETDQTLESIESILIIIEESTIKVLDISRIIPNSFYTKYNQATLADDLGVAIKLNSNLVELHIQKLEFDGHDVEILLNGLKVNTSLKILDLGYNNIGDVGMELIAIWLKNRPVLQGLSVAANGIKMLGARALSFGMPFSRLRYLNMSKNHIDDQGLTDLLDSIKKSPMMRFLFLWGNRWGQIACKRLHRMIKSGVLEQEYTDVKVNIVDNEYQPVFYPANSFKFNYYSVMNFGYPETLKIKRNQVEGPLDQPRALLNLPHVGRYPKIDRSLGPKKIKEPICDGEYSKIENYQEDNIDIESVYVMQAERDEGADLDDQWDFESA